MTTVDQYPNMNYTSCIRNGFNRLIVQSVEGFYSCDCGTSVWNINGTVHHFEHPDCKYHPELFDLILPIRTNLQSYNKWWSITMQGSVTSNVTADNPIELHHISISKSNRINIVTDVSIDEIIVKEPSNYTILTSFSFTNISFYNDIKD